MFSISIPFPRRERGRKKQQGGRKREGAGAATGAAKPARPRPAWDATSSDLSRHRLTQAELEFRRSLRQSRHRSHSQGAVPEGSALTEEALGALELQGEGQQWGSTQQDEVAVQDDGSGLDGGNAGSESDGGSSAGSLAGMRAFVADLQRKYGLPGAPSAEHPQTLASLLHQQLEREETELGAGPDAGETYASDACDSSGDEGENHSGRATSHPAATAARQQRRSSSRSEAAAAADGSDSEGCGRLGPAALRRAQQRQALSVAVCGSPPRHAATALTALPALQHQALLDRMAAAEARLHQLEGLPAQLQEAQGAVAQLRAQNEQLQTDLDEFVSHTSTLLTSLQTQLSGFLSSQAQAGSSSPNLAAAGRLPQQRPPSPTATRPPAAVVQARAAAAALSIAHQARALAHGAAPPDSLPTAASGMRQAREAERQSPATALSGCPADSRRQHDVLSDLQLPSFRRFAELRGMAAATSKPPPAAADLPPPAAHPTGGFSAENSPPQPQALPQSLARHSTGLAPAAGASFLWCPLSPAS